MGMYLEQIESMFITSPFNNNQINKIGKEDERYEPWR